MDAMTALALLTALVAFAALASIFGVDSRDYRPDDVVGGTR